MRPGSHRLSWGNATVIARKITSMIKKGNTPLISSILEISKLFLTRKKFMPMGGVISAISIFITNNIPNQSGSKPRSVIIGIKIGTVSIIMVIPSIKHPRNRRKIIIAIITAIGGRFNDAIIPFSLAVKKFLVNEENINDKYVEDPIYIGIDVDKFHIIDKARTET